MTDLFKEIIPSILLTKKNCIVDNVTEKSYAPYMVNKALSYHIDCIMQANMMNANYGIPNKMQYDYLFDSVRAKKRPFHKWVKKEEMADVEAIKLYFGYSSRAAREVLRAKLLSDDQLAYIRKQTQIN